MAQNVTPMINKKGIATLAKFISSFKHTEKKMNKDINTTKKHLKPDLTLLLS